ncbi:hypothetical protein EVAR_81709_1 [Eumeta japonica]|uniref:Uncharacterized protein n=1 Tax=Eumeta variegata TaxID=151549 RepID=A0A4C1UI55_EUMVA|nr:hypothetical protein EVAR_81709_1 [Eumeta japonica]
MRKLFFFASIEHREFRSNTMYNHRTRKCRPHELPSGTPVRLTDIVHQTSNTGTSRAAPFVPSDDLSRGPYLFEAPLRSHSKSSCELSATLSARNAFGHVMKAFGLIARSEEMF